MTESDCDDRLTLASRAMWRTVDAIEYVLAVIEQAKRRRLRR